MDSLLDRVERPSRYLGNELNAITKDLSQVTLKVGLGYPDLYEIGMSNTGLHILYYMLNEQRADVAAERVYLPALDLEQLLEAEGERLTTLENRIPLAELDVLGIQIPHELAYANIVKMLRLGGVPIWTHERQGLEPLILGGGPGVFGAEPVAPFYDAMLLGDAEDALWEILAVYERWKGEHTASGAPRSLLLERLSRVTGVYVPSLYEVDYGPEGQVSQIRGLPRTHEPQAGSDDGDPAPLPVHKAVVEDLEQAFYPDKAIVPYAETVHNRLGVEVMRGCTVGCRFCQAGMIYRPVRERSPRRILDLAKCGLGATGFEDVSLLSLDTGDYTLIDPLTKELLRSTADKRVALSLPSLRAGSLTDDVIEDIQRVRRTSFTIAPEAGTQRLRDVINKNISDEEIFETVERVAKAGWKGIKLYFMVGFPTERQDDLDGMVELVQRCRKIARRYVSNFSATASVGTLVPKPHTPFQWDEQISQEESERRIHYLRHEFKARRISFKFHAPHHSFMEGAFSRADRRLAPLIAEAEARGGGFESWSDRLNMPLWEELFAEHELDMRWFLRRRDYAEILPWDHLSARVTKKFLLADRKKLDRLAEPTTFDCRDDLCAGCSACFTEDIRNRLAKYHPDPFQDGRRLPVALTSRVAMGHGVAQQLEKQATVSGESEAEPEARDQAARAGAQALAAKLRRSRRPANPSSRRWAVTPGEPGYEGPARAFLGGEDPRNLTGETQATDPLSPAEAPPGAESAESSGESPAATPDPRPPQFHYRVSYSRDGRLRWLSHRETMRVFYRGLTRSELPLAYTTGFHPKPKVAFGPPLPVGAESDEEELDLYLTEEWEPARVVAELSRVLPTDQGIRPRAAQPHQGKSAHSERLGGRWAVRLDSVPGYAPASATAALGSFAAAEERWLEIARPGKKPRRIDLKTIVREVQLTADQLCFDLIQDGPSAKPSEVVAALLDVDRARTPQARYRLVQALRRP